MVINTSRCMWNNLWCEIQWANVFSDAVERWKFRNFVFKLLNLVDHIRVKLKRTIWGSFPYIVIPIPTTMTSCCLTRNILQTLLTTWCLVSRLFLFKPPSKDPPLLLIPSTVFIVYYLRKVSAWRKSVSYLNLKNRSKLTCCSLVVRRLCTIRREFLFLFSDLSHSKVVNSKATVLY